MARLSMRTIAFSALALQIVLLRSSDGTSKTDVDDHAMQRDTRIPDLWLSDLFYRALANFTLRRAAGTECRRQTAVYERDLRNHTSWAVRMQESWNRYPVGLLAGNTYQMGVYDECVDLRYPVKGQYCLSEIKLIPPADRNYSFERTEDLDDFGNNHAWKTVLGWADYQDQMHRNILKLGVCIPDTCSALDLQTSLQNEFDEVFPPEQFRTIVKVDPIMCTVRENKFPYDTPYYVTVWILLLLFLICCCVTLYHFVRILYHKNTNENDRVPNSFFYEFSFIVSIKSLLNYDKNNELNFYYAMKVMIILSITYGHKVLILMSHPISNAKYIDSLYLDRPPILLTGLNIVDPFFFISGYLMYINLAREFRKPKDESVWKTLLLPIFQRILRILPAYCAMIAITAYIIPHLGHGPLWPNDSWEEAKICKDYWWANLLFISNFVDIKHQCLFVSWHLSCDMQYFIIGVFVVYILIKTPKKGIALLGTLVGLSIVVPFIVTLWTGRDGIDKISTDVLIYMRNVMWLNKSYRPSYMRAAPFFGGLTMSVVNEKLKKRKVKFSQIVVHSGLIAICTLTWGAQFYGTVFFVRNRPYYPLEHALYSTICHCTWAVTGIWGTMTYFTSGYGILNFVFNNRIFTIMGKLSYSVSLVNMNFFLLSQSSQRLPSHMTSKYLIGFWIIDSFMCYLISIILYLVVEEPFGKLTGKLFYHWKNKNSLINFGTPIEKPTISSSNTVKND